MYRLQNKYINRIRTLYIYYFFYFSSCEFLISVSYNHSTDLYPRPSVREDSDYRQSVFNSFFQFFFQSH